MDRKNVALVIFLIAVVATLAALVALGPDAWRAHKAKSAVAENLIDPDSAKFRNVEIIGSYVCGEVNGKNGFGAYAGYQKFAVLGSVVMLEESGFMSDMIAERCR